MRANKSWNDRKMDIVIGGLLRAGVSLSAVTVFIGAILYLAKNGRAPVNYRMFHGETADFRTVGGILRDAVALRGKGIIQLGLLFLIATPVVRVAFSIFGFAWEQDRMYAVVASIVLLILLYSIVFS
jgi:uncharacterized membrane protein